MQKPNFDLPYIAKLSCLQFSDADLHTFTKDFTQIIQLVTELQTIDTAGIEPMAHPLELPQILREDSVTEIDQHAEFQSIAPCVEHDLYLVPKVIESE